MGKEAYQSDQHEEKTFISNHIVFNATRKHKHLLVIKVMTNHTPCSIVSLIPIAQDFLTEL